MDSVNFEITYVALKMFGKQLYSNVGSAISELVANGIDAEARNVYVSIDMTEKKRATVEIFDDGKGMSSGEIKDHYVKIGYNKRLDEASRTGNILGRKGIGKLAALYLSDCFTVITKKDGETPTEWCLDVSATSDNEKPQLIEKNIEITTDFNCYSKWQGTSHGTLIFLRNVNLERMGARKLESLERNLSNFFLYDAINSEIWINIFDDLEKKGKFVKVQKHVAFKNMVTIFTNDVSSFSNISGSRFKVPYKDKFGNVKNYDAEVSIKQFAEVSGIQTDGEIDGIPYTLKGWVGVHSSIDNETAIQNDENYIKNSYYNPNQLRLYVRNKLGMANMLEHLGIDRAFAHYIEGEIEFDILDDDRLEDIATAGRQDFDTQDDRFVKLKEMMIVIGNALVRERQTLADNIRNKRQHVDNDISTKAKVIFAREVRQEIDAITEFNPASKTKLETIITNKIQGDLGTDVKAQYTVFLSHARQDRMISDCIYNYLIKLGFDGTIGSQNCEIFYSSSGLDTNNLEPLSKVIRDAIISKNNDILFLTSNNFNKSQFCLFEGGAAWATRSIGEYKILSLKYSDIPTFLTNGKSEISLEVNKAEDFELDGVKYNQLVNVINRLITHLNKNREVVGSDNVPTLDIVKFPDKVELKATNSTEQQFMDSDLLSYWNTYVVANAQMYNF